MIVRHDRVGAEFLIKDADFPAVFSLDASRPRGVGTLVHPEFLLTAAHTAEKLQVGSSVIIGETEHQALGIHLHPTWTARAGSRGTDERFGFADVALVP